MKKYLLFSLGPLGAALLSLITLPILTWHFSPSDVGRLAMLNLAASFAILVFSLGLDQAFIRWYHDVNDKPTLFKSALVPGLLLLVVVIVALTFYLGELSEFILELYSIKYGQYIIVFIILSYFARFFPLILRMNIQGGLYSICQIIPKIVLLLLLQCLYFSDVNDKIEFLLIIQCLSLTAVVLFSGIMTRKVWSASFNFDFNKDTLYGMLKFGFPLILGSAAFWGLTAIDKIFLKYFISLEELAVYSVAVNVAGVAVIVQSVFSTIWAPIVYKWNTSLNVKSCVNKINEMIGFITLIISVIICVVGLLSWSLRFIFPDAYDLIPFIVVSCLSFPLFYTLSEVTVVGINLAKKTVFSMIASLITVLINICFNYFLIPKFGAAGAAIATAISMWFFMVIRTELSVYVWEKFHRTKMYIVSFILLITSSLFSILGEQFFYSFMLAWGGGLMLTLFLYSKELKIILSYIARNISQNLFKEKD